MQRLKVSGAVRLTHRSLGFEGLKVCTQSVAKTLDTRRNALLQIYLHYTYVD